MISKWLSISLEELWLIPLSTALILGAAIAAIRIAGLRSLSKMSSFDFLVTVAMGSVLATVAATSTSVINGALALCALLGVQAIVAFVRKTSRFGGMIDNEPLLLMDGTELLDDALRSSRVTRLDVVAKLREANVTRMDQVLAVVLETTGDISVLHGEGPLEPSLLDGVRRIS